MSRRRTTGSSGPGALSRPGLIERLGQIDPLERLGTLSWRRPVNFARGSGVVLGSFVAILVGLAVTVALVGGVADGVTHLTTSSSPAPVGPHGQVIETMKIITGSLTDFGDQPQYTDPSWTVHAGERVTVKIISYDDGTAPLMGSQMMYDQVLGSTTGKELVAGRAVSSVSDTNVSHTFTVVGLRFNMPIPAAPTGKSVIVEATFIPTKTGTFTWQCYAPCGAGTNGMGGAMSTKRWMEGTIKVTA